MLQASQGTKLKLSLALGSESSKNEQSSSQSDSDSRKHTEESGGFQSILWRGVPRSEFSLAWP